jgi:D-alanyl-D-alanine carboxypeptidase
MKLPHWSWAPSLLVAAILVLTAVFPSPAEAARAPRQRYTPPKAAALIVDATSGRVLYERDSHAVRHPASLTKMMTLYMLFDALEKGTITLQTEMVASSRATSVIPTKINLRPGEKLDVETAIKALVIQSANDAAVVIAEHLGGSEATFGEMMTKKSREIGMASSNFVNANGLPDVRQTTTAADMAMLARRLAYDFPQYFPYFAVRSFTHKGRRYNTHNHVLEQYGGTDGIKTGYTRMSGFNLVSSVVRDNKHIVGVVLGGTSAATRDREMMRLMQIAFDEAGKNPLLVSFANVPWHNNPGEKTRPNWNMPAPPSIELAGFSTGTPPPRAVRLPPVPTVRVTPQVALATPAPKNVIVPRPRPAEAPKPDPVLAIIAAENKTAVGIDGASFVPAARLALVLPKPRPVMTTGATPNATLGKSVGDTVKRWAVQIGAFNDKLTAQAQLAKYAERSMDVVGQADRIVAPVTAEAGQTMYRARFGLFGENEARAVCRRMTSRGETCFAVQAT